MEFFKLYNKDSSTEARTGLLRFPRKESFIEVETPVFMPVGTHATVKSLWQEDLEDLGYKLILANTYHLSLRPGSELIAGLGGTRKFMSWDGALLTDSGGFQAYSLADRVKYQEDGIEFASHLDGTRHFFTPESVVDIQRNLGSDVMMVLDDCPPGDSDSKRLREALKRTHRWAELSTKYYQQLTESNQLKPKNSKLFGIIQGGINQEFRQESLEFIQSLPFQGIAIGGLSVGESRESFYSILEYLSKHLDPTRPRYLMGVGTVPDILEGVKNGIDMFDCVLPTRNARNGQVFTSFGKINLRNAQYIDLDQPIDPDCDCRVCRRYSLAYLRHLFTCKEMLGPQMASHHNLYYIYKFMTEMRHAIKENQFKKFYSRWKKISY